MKKREGHLGDFLPPVRLYLDDVEALCAMIQRVFAEVSIQAGAYMLDGTAELTDLGVDRISELEIIGREHPRQASIQLQKGRFGAIFLFCYPDDFEMRGLHEELKAMLLRRQRWLVRWISGYTGVTVILVLGAIAVGSWMSGFTTPPFLIARAGLPFVALPLLAIGAWYNERGAKVIHLARRRDSPGFLARNRDALIINALVVVATAIATYFVTVATTRH